MKKLTFIGSIMIFAIIANLCFSCKKKDAEPAATCSDGIQNQNETAVAVVHALHAHPVLME